MIISVCRALYLRARHELSLVSFAPLHFLRELREKCERVSNDNQICDREDRRVLILIDGDDILGAFHAREVLNSSTDTTGDVERWLYGLAGLTNLVAIGQPASIDDGASSTCGAAQRGSKFLNEMEIFGFTQTATTADNDTGVFERRSFAG